MGSAYDLGVNHSKISAIADDMEQGKHTAVGVNHSKISAIADSRGQQTQYSKV